jgi:AcrR family transcriptional regulator
MTHPRFGNLPEAKRKRILEAAAKEFGSCGYEGASLNRILAAAGISKGGAYYYFEDKADLFDAVVQHYMQTAIATLAFPTQDLDREAFWRAIGDVYARSMDLLEETPWLLGIAKACWKLPQEGSEGPLARIRKQARELVGRAMRVGQRSGAVRSDLPDELLIDLAVGIDEILDRWLADHIDSLSRDELMTAMARYPVILRSVLEPPEEKP